MRIITQVEQVVDAEEVAATKLEEDEDVNETTERIVTAVAMSAQIQRSTAGTTAPFATRINRSMKPSMLVLNT